MSLRNRRFPLGWLHRRAIRGYQDLDTRGRLEDTANPAMLGVLVFLSVVAIAFTMYSAGRTHSSSTTLWLSVIAAFGVATAAAIALGSSRYQTLKQLAEAQTELLALHGELELERSTHSALLHDTRAVVGAMGAALHALERSGEQRETGKAISAQVDHLRTLLSTPTSTLRPTSLDRFREPLISFADLHGISLSVDLPLQVHVMADPASITTILQNLIDNARKYAPGSPVRVIWEPAGTHVRVCVEDRGPGMGDEAEGLFSQGVRGGDEADGFGLGLATARRLAEQNQGALWYEHQDGPGSRFVLKLLRASTTGTEGGTL